MSICVLTNHELHGIFYLWYYLWQEICAINAQSGYLNKRAVLVIILMRSLVSIEQQSPRRPCDIKRFMFCAPSETFTCWDVIIKYPEVCCTNFHQMLWQAQSFSLHFFRQHIVFWFFWELWVVLNCFGLGMLYYKRHCVWGDPLEKERKYLH